MPSQLARKLARAVILISGRGSNMQMLLKAASAGSCAINPVAVISDQADAQGLTIAKAAGVATHVIDPQNFPSRDLFDCELAQLIAKLQADIIILAGFMRILGAPFTQVFAGKILNIHPSLLPKFKGLHTHQRALDAGEQQHGASVHFVNQELDAGAVILQSVVGVKPSDSAESLAARVLQTEHQILPLAVDWLARGLLVYSPQQITLCELALDAPILFADGQLQSPLPCIEQLQPR